MGIYIYTLVQLLLLLDMGFYELWYQSNSDHGVPVVVLS